MKDLGSKPSETLKMPEKYYPSVTVDASDFKGLLDKEIGKECIVRMRVKKTGERINRDDHKIDLELRGMEIEKPNPKSIKDAAKAATEY